MNDNLHERLALEIHYRLQSNEWDKTIAHRVIRSRKNRMRTIFLSAAIIPLIFVIGIMAFLNKNNPGSVSPEDLVSRQIEGTYASVFPQGNENFSENTPLRELDMLVDEVLSQR
ncbi:MAG: hypothetical protein N2316_10280 [Spirochaetes bacterium]|nr:hypothetical protein [Spirochaetota bacterium]